MDCLRRYGPGSDEDARGGVVHPPRNTAHFCILQHNRCLITTSGLPQLTKNTYTYPAAALLRSLGGRTDERQTIVYTYQRRAKEAVSL